MSISFASLLLASLSIVPTPAPIQDSAAGKAAKEAAAALEADFAKLERAIPRDVFLYAAVRDLDSLREDLASNAWYGFFRDPEIRAWIDWGIRQNGGFDFEDAPVDPFALASSVHGSAAAFMTWDKDLKEPSSGGILVQPGKERDAFDAQLDRLLEHARAAASSSTEKYGTTELEILEENEGKTIAVHFDLPDVVGFVIGEKRELVLSTAHAILDRYLGKDSAEGIAGEALLAEARKSTDRRGRLELFLDTAPIFALKEQAPPDKDAQLVFDLTGALDVRWAYLSADAGSGESFDLTLAADVPQAGLLKSMYDALGPFPAEWLKLCPKSSTSLGLANFDIWAVWQAGWKRFGELAPEQHKAARAQIEGLTQSLGLDIEGKLLSQLDGRYGSFKVEVPLEEWTPIDGQQFEALGLSAPEGPKLGTAYLIGIRDRAAVEAFVDKVLEIVSTQGMVGPEDVDTVEFQGHEVQELELPMGAKVGWSFLDHALVLSVYPTALRAALRLEGKPDEPTAASNPGFAAVLKSLAGAPAVGINDTRATLELVLSALRGGLAAYEMTKSQPTEAAEGEGDEEHPPEPKGGAHPPIPGTELVQRYFKGTVTTAMTKRAGSVQFVISAR